MMLLFEGVLVGLSIAAPVGAIGFLCIQHTLHHGMVTGIAAGLGAATADTCYGILVALGLTALQSWLLYYKVPLTIIGGLFLCYLGIKKITATVPHIHTTKTTHANLFKTYTITFFLTLTNPTTILDFMALFTSLNINTTSWGNSLSFVGGVFVGSALWWFILCGTVGLLRHKVSQSALHYINYGAGLMIFSFGIYALVKLFIH